MLSGLIGLLLGFLLCYTFFVPNVKPVPEGENRGSVVGDEQSIDLLSDSTDFQSNDSMVFVEEDSLQLSLHDTFPLPGEIVPNELLLPVLGVPPEQLYDSYNDSRSEGRTHEAIDIPAPEGRPVLAAISGEVVKLFVSEKGGITLYERGTDGRIYYYAHMAGYAPDIQEGKIVRRGEVIGYVGNSGNAGPENYHLHFAIWIPEDSTHYWDGESINPYPLLRTK